VSVWIAVIATSAGCYGLKLAGLTVPRRMLDNAQVRRFADFVPVALLAALCAVQAVAVLSHDQALTLDIPRLAGLAAAVAALLKRAPFIVVLVAAAAVTAGLRALAGLIGAG
jgi:branched-subunit amino acid transport protein